MTTASPPSSRRPRTRPLVLGHRGASAAAPENTIEAFALARELGADGVELDVRRTADDVLVLHHDPDATGLGLLREVPFADVRAARPDIPTLAEALDELAGLIVNVEIKCLPNEPDHDPAGDVVRAVVALVAARDAYGDVVISSFDMTAVDLVRSLDPAIETGFLLTGLDPAIDVGIAAAARRRHRWIHPMYQMLVANGAAELLGAAREQRLLTNTWTLDDPEIAQTLAGQGIEGVITNVPDVILAAFA